MAKGKNTTADKGAKPAPKPEASKEAVETKTDAPIESTKVEEKVSTEETNPSEAKETKDQPKGKAKASFVVKKQFKDAPQYRKNGNANTYEVGADVSSFDAQRLNDLVSRGFVEQK